MLRSIRYCVCLSSYGGVQLQAFKSDKSTRLPWLLRACSVAQHWLDPTHSKVQQPLANGKYKLAEYYGAVSMLSFKHLDGMTSWV